MGQKRGLYALPDGTGAGPAVWCHGLFPDYHAFRGSYGGYAFPLYDGAGYQRAECSPRNHREPERGIRRGSGRRGCLPCNTMLTFGASYTLRFAEDLEDVFPHVPFPARHAIFRDAVRLGHEIRAVETFARQPGEAYRRHEFVASHPATRHSVAGRI